MNPVQKRVLVGLGLCSCAALAVAHLALTDIYHGESDTSLEWTVLRICFGVFATFIIVNFIILFRVRTRPDAS